MRFLDNVLQRLYRARARRDGAGQVQRRARAQRRPRRDGLPLLPAGARPPVRRGDGQIVEPEDLQAYPRPGRRGLADARQRARPLPRRGRHGRDGALQLQDGDRADRVDLDHLRRHLGLHRADPGQHLHPQDAVGLDLDPQPASRAAADREVEEQRRHLVDDPRARRLGPASRFPHARGKGRVQDQLRDRPALADRARRRPHALYRPGDHR